MSTILISKNLLNSAADSDGYDFLGNDEVTVKSGITVKSTKGDGIDSNYSCYLHNNGQIISAIDDGVFFGVSLGDSYLINHGGIQGSFCGVVDDGNEDVIFNYGHITSANTGVIFDGLSRRSALNNYGVVNGTAFGVQVFTQDFGFHGASIDNWSNITSKGTAIENSISAGLTTIIFNELNAVLSGGHNSILNDGYGNIALTNYGTINGTIKLHVQGGTDVVNNHGKINGNVLLYGSSDIFNGKGGTSGTIRCGHGDYQVVAGKGNVEILVGDGNSKFTAGSGHDRFVFATTGPNFETITNFAHGLDKIVLSEHHFAGLGPLGALAATHFHSGTAVNGHAQIDYFQGTGVLEYCPHGNLGPVYHFATLANHAHINAGDFSLIA